MSGGDWKAMFKGVQEGDLGLVEFYLNQGIDPNYQHPEYMASALVESIRFNHLDITRFLLENGANPEVVEDFEGDTPLSVARLKRNKQAEALILEYINKK